MSRGQYYPKKVAFDLPAYFSRPASGNELRVADQFADHIDNCHQCVTLIYWQGFSNIDPRDLCHISRRLAHHVSIYLCYYQDNVYSTISEEQGESVRVEMPKDLQCIKPLLRAMTQVPARWIHRDTQNKPPHTNTFGTRYGPQQMDTYNLQGKPRQADNRSTDAYRNPKQVYTNNSQDTYRRTNDYNNNSNDSNNKTNNTQYKPRQTNTYKQYRPKYTSYWIR